LTNLQNPLNIFRRTVSFLITPLLIWFAPASNCGFSITAICVFLLLKLAIAGKYFPQAYKRHVG
jgi:hypothetical protein